ncbi:MAG TPA: DUF1491 family protein [Sphingomonas sp.]|jgi:hypothetical protein
MSARLPASLVASALMRRVQEAGGFAAVLARGDPDSGAMLLVARDRDNNHRLFERGLGPKGESAMIDSTPTDSSPDSVEDYWRKRRQRDPDLWVIELDIPDAERFAAETMT